MIETSITVTFSFEEVCEIAELPGEILHDIVAEGVIEPEGESPDDWTFDTAMLSLCKSAVRLHRDLGIEWSGITFYLDMLEQVKLLRDENKKLRQRLERFLLDE